MRASALEPLARVHFLSEAARAMQRATRRGRDGRAATKQLADDRYGRAVGVREAAA